MCWAVGWGADTVPLIPEDPSSHPLIPVARERVERASRGHRTADVPEERVLTPKGLLS